MSMMRYTYDYNGMRYTIDAPANATAADLQAIIDGGAKAPAQPAAAPTRPAQTTGEVVPPKEVEPAGIFEYFTNREEAIRKDREYRAYLQDKMQRTELEDIKTQTGFFDRLGDLFSRGLLSARSGIKDVEAAIETDPALKKQFTQEARRFAADAGVEIKGATTEQDVKDNFLRNVIPYVIEKGAESIPQMIASTNPLGVLGVSLPSNLGSQARDAAELEGRQDVTATDVAKVAPGAVTVTALDALGLGGILAAPAKTALGRIGKAALLEGITEAIQSAIEYANPRVVTGSDVDAGELFEQAAFGALAGGGTGGGLRATGEIATAPFRKKEKPTPEADAEESPKVKQEYLRLVSEATAARMRAEPGLTQRQAFDQVIRDAGKFYQTAIANVAGEGAADVDTGLDVSEGVGTGVPPTGEPGITSDVTGTPAEPAAGGVGELDTGVPPVDTGAAPGIPALDLGDFAPAVAAVQEAPNNKARKSLAMQLVSDVVQANPDLQGLPNSKYNQAANQIVLAAARGEQFDPVAIVQGIAPKSKAAPEAAAPEAVAPEAVAPEAIAPESAPTPQQIVENLPAFAAQEAQDRGLDPGMFREGARDAVRGVEPLDDALILEAQGQEALDAYKSGIQWAQERFADLQAQPAVEKAPQEVLDKLGKEWEEAEDLYNSTYRNEELSPEGMSDKETEMFLRGHDKAWNDSQRAAANYFRASGDTKQLKFYLGQISNRTDAEQVELNQLVNAATNDDFSGPVEFDPNNPDDVDKFARMLRTSRPGDVQVKTAADFNRGVEELPQPAPEQTFEDIGKPNSELISGPSSNDIAFRAEELPEVARVNVRARLDRIMARHAKDGDTERLVGSLEALRQDVDTRIDRERTKRGRDRVRGFERAMEVIYRAERNEQLSPEGAQLVRWLLEQNPAIADELALSIREGGDQKAAGQYSPAARLATIFTTRANDATATHEVLHHAERLMPENVRAGIRAAWMKRIQDLIKIAEQTDNTKMREVLGAIVRAYYGDAESQKALKEAFEAGTIPYSAYHLSNPSEFWAVNAADLVGRRAKQTGWLKDARNWIRELIEKAKDLLGLPNESAIITGLKAILEVESGTISGTMLSDKSDVFRVYGGEGATNPNRSKLAEAQALEVAEGAISGPTGNIRAKTGWFRGVDGMWRFEIDDRDMRFQPGYEPIRLVKGRTYLLGQIIAHPELFRQYPSLQQVNVVVKDTEGGGYWDWTKNEIAISDKTPTIENYYLNTLVHEIQHAVQRWENFANGASTRSYPVSSAAVRKALSFLDKFKDNSLFLWDKTYKRADLKAMRDDLEVLRDTFGNSLDKAYADWEAYENSVRDLNAERWQRRRDAVDAWWESDHPEAVKHRELRDARIALGKQLRDYEAQRLLTPEQRAELKQQFDAAAEASQAQYKYAAGLADMLAQPDISDLETRFKELSDVAKKVGERIKQAQDVAELHGANKLMYYLTAGEVEARDVERRRTMSPAQRESEAPYVGDPFGELSDMILVDQLSGRSSAPPKVVANGKEIKLTEAQTRAALEKAATIRRKMNRIQQRIANTNRTADILSGQIELGKLARGDKENWALLRGAIDTLDVSRWRVILPTLSTEDIFRILKDRIPGLNEADRIIRQDITRFETKEYLHLADELEQIADFLKKYPKAAQALSDLQFATVAYQVDPSKALTAEEYADKFDKKTRSLRTELGNTSVVDTKGQRKLKTKIDNRLKEIKSVYEGAVVDDGRVFGWRDLARPELGANKGKEIFKLIRDAHRKDLEASYQAIRSRLMETKEGEKLDEALEKLEKQFKPARDQTIYFPAMRFGKFYARVGTGANSIFKMFETETKRNQFVRLMKARGESVTETGNVEDLRNDFEKITGGPMKEVLDLFEDNPKDIGALRSQVFDLWLQTMSQGDMRKHMAPRKMRAGYSTDILKNFANFRRSSINSVKRARYGYKLRNEISRATDSLEEQPDRTKMQEFIKEIELRVMSDLTPPERGGSRWQQALQLGNKVAFYQYLANPKTAIIQLTQLHIVAFPMLAQKYGTAKAGAALAKYGFSSLGGFVTSPLKAIKRENGSFTFDWKQPNLLDNPISALKQESDPELYEVLSEGWQDGRDLNLWLDTFANDIGGYGMADPKQRNALQELAAGRPVTATLRGATFVFEAMGTLMHQMERVNREATFMAALELEYREARKAGKSHAEAKKIAVEDATATTLAATFDFSAYNKPRVLTTGVGRVAGQFYTYPYMMTSLLARNMYTAIKVSGLEPGERSAAIKVATGSLVNISLYAGLTGVPLYGIFKAMGFMLSALFGDDEEEGLRYVDANGNVRFTYNVDWWFRNVWIPEFFGPDGTVANLLGLDDDTAATLARAAEKGPISAITDIDLSNSVALDFMFFLPQESRAETPEGKFIEYTFNVLAGAFGGTVLDYIKAGQDVATGYSDRALEKLPKLFSNVAKANRFGAEGQLNYAGELSGMDKDFWTSDKQILLSLGFNSTEAAQRQQQNYEGREITKKIEKSRNDVLAKFRKVAIDVEKEGGMTDAIQPDLDDAHDAARKFNETHPQYMIGPDTVYEAQMNAILKMRESRFYEGVPIDKRGRTPYLEDILRRRTQPEEVE